MYTASIENHGDSKYHATTKDYDFIIDTAGKGANPIDTLLAALCGCIGHYVNNYIGEEHIDASGFKVRAEAELTSNREKLSDIRMHIDMKDTKLDEGQSKKLLKYVEGCPVHKTLKANSKIVITLDGQG